MPSTKETTLIPSKVQDFTILPLRLPSQPAYPSKQATHYLYLRRDAPKPGDEPTADIKRSIFVANLPIDATENNVRKLFKEICGARVERVEFDEETQGQRRGLVLGREMVVQGTVVNVPVDVGKGKKRKRGAAEAEEEVVRRTMEEMALPEVWHRRVLKSGGCCVVVFVDESSREGALKECARVKRKGRVVEWPSVEGEELGLQRESHLWQLFSSGG
jgi:ribosomal RNA-processing protein 7